MIDHRKKIVGLESNDTDVYLQEIEKLHGVQDLIVFPDAFLKDKYKEAAYKTTIPSSMAIRSSEECLYPQFRPRGIGCGMMSIVLPWKKDDVSEEKIIELFDQLAYSYMYYALYRLRIPFGGTKHDLTASEFYKIVTDGFAYGSKRFSVDIEHDNSIELTYKTNSVSSDDIDTYLNKDWFTKRTARLRHSFGRYFGGNHYAEVQEVQNDVTIGGKKLEKGQLMLSIHTGCLSLIDIIKPKFVEQTITQQSYTCVAKDDEAYRAFFVGQQVLLNYTHMYRLATFAIVRDFIKKYSTKDPYILLERAHNYTVQDTNGGESLIYRHNVNALQEDDYALLSGRYDFDSYIIQGKGKQTSNLNSVDHGVGYILKKDMSIRELSDSKVTLLRYTKGLRNRKTMSSTQLLDSSLVSSYIAYMQKNEYFDSIVGLRPIYNMKYTR